MRSIARALLAASCLNRLPGAGAAVADPRDATTLLESRSEEQLPLAVDKSYWYDWGWYGSYPAQTFESFGAVAPLLNLKSNSDDCYDTYTFIAPRGKYVHRPAAMILNNRGDPIWIHTQHGQAMDLMVQEYKGKDYITFWTGYDNGTFGIGTYLMVSRTCFAAWMAWRRRSACVGDSRFTCRVVGSRPQIPVSEDWLTITAA